MESIIEIPLDQTSTAASFPELTPQLLRSIGVLSPSMVDRICADRTQTRFLVEGLLPIKSIAIVAGDSTIGKSPLVLQLALCVAAGLPFLAMPTTQGRVLYFDLENSLPDCKDMRDALVQFLGLSETPKDFLLATEPHELEHLIKEVRLRLVVIDSVRSFRPDVTERNSQAGGWLKEIRRLCRKYECTFLLVHHVRKPARQHGIAVEPDLQSMPVSAWMLEMEGPRAFVNQTDVRIAAARLISDSDVAALGVKWSRRVHGDSPFVLLERVFDDNGDPAGYRHLTGAAQLSPQHREALEKLAADFRSKDVKNALNCRDQAANEFLHECMHLGLIVKISRGRYRKVAPVVAQAELQIPLAFQGAE